MGDPVYPFFLVGFSAVLVAIAYLRDWLVARREAQIKAEKAANRKAKRQAKKARTAAEAAARQEAIEAAGNVVVLYRRA